MNIRWSRPEQRWYLGVRCRRCHSPILFAVDHNEGTEANEPPSAGMLVLTCTIDDCKHRADYTNAVVLRLQKSPDDLNKTMRSTTIAKSSSKYKA